MGFLLWPGEPVCQALTKRDKPPFRIERGLFPGPVINFLSYGPCANRGSLHDFFIRAGSILQTLDKDDSMHHAMLNREELMAGVFQADLVPAALRQIGRNLLLRIAGASPAEYTNRSSFHFTPANLLARPSGYRPEAARDCVQCEIQALVHADFRHCPVMNVGQNRKCIRGRRCKGLDSDLVIKHRWSKRDHIKDVGRAHIISDRPVARMIII